MIITEMGWIVKEVEKLVSKSGKPFFSFQFSAKKIKKPKVEEESPYIYYSCFLHPSRENVVKFIRKSSLVVISGELYSFGAYFSEIKKQIVVKPEINVFSIQFIPKGNSNQSARLSHLYERKPQAIEPRTPSEEEEVSHPFLTPPSQQIPEWKKDAAELPF